MREWFARLRDWLRRDRLDRELTEELRFHRERLERDAAALGVDPEEAAFAARRRLGSVVRAREESRDRWSWPWLDHFFKDVRYALRGLRRSPGFTTTVILTLGLGIGANAAMFGVIDRLMFRPYPLLRDPRRVHRVYLQWNERGRTVTNVAYEYARYLDLKKWTSAFSQSAGIAEETLAVGTGESTHEQRVAAVSASFFDFFDAQPALGRFFGVAEDTTPKGAPVAVLSYGFWQTEFGGDDVIGRTLQVGNITCIIVGVAPEGFIGVSAREPATVFIPITTFAGYSGTLDAATYFTQYHWGWMSVMVRRKPGVSEIAASADLSGAFLRSWNYEASLDPESTPAAIAGPRAVVGPLKTAAGPDLGLESRTLLWLTGVAGVVLLIACANVANLMFARVLRRRREIAVRLALGVSRRRLMAQCLTESLILAALGCLAGVVFAQWGGMALRRLFLPAGDGLDVLTDGRTLALALASAFALLTGIFTGMGPAFLAVRADLVGNLKAGAREGTSDRSRTRSALLVLQGALSVILLVGAGLFVRSLNHVRAMRLGYDVESVLIARRNLRGLQPRYSDLILLNRRLLESAQAIPGVESAAWVSSVPFASTSSTDFFVPGIDSVGRLGRFTFQSATQDYFKAMGTRILRGRAFEETDGAGTALVVVVSESMARVLWPGRDALGQCMRVSADTMPCSTVIGIAEDAIQNKLTEEQRFRYYLPLVQYRPTGGHSLLLRMRGNPATSVESVHRVLQRVMPGQTYVTVRPLRDLVEAQRHSWQVGATMFVAFGGLALLVAAIGLYGVITYNVAQRRHELGVRIALAGVLLGLALALLGARWIQPLLFQQSAKDPSTYGMVALLLLTVALVASVVPAMRAARANPNAALRGE